MKTEQDINENIVGQQQRNAELLAVLRDKGVQIDEERPIEHHFWGARQEDAALLAKMLYTNGYLVLEIAPVDTDDGSECWNVEARIEQTPRFAASRQLSEELARMAARFDCDYDGWGTRI
jgi:regulator of RNase E activity RraB